MATRILCVSRPRVKPTRTSPRPTASFGQGVLPSHPTFQVDHNAADAEWWSRESNPERYSADFDYWAAVSDAIDRQTNGHLL